jgi:DNA-binding NarL/FixJ family response regulator
MTKRIRVFHVEDYKIMRDGIKTMLVQDNEIDYVGEAKNGEELLALMPQTPIDVLIIDLFLDAMEGITTMNGFELCSLVRDRYPSVQIVAHSMYDDADRVAKVLKAGAVSFVSKKSGFDELIKAIKHAFNGKRYICTETSARLKNLNSFLSGLDPTLRAHGELFSLRERQVLELLSSGLSSKEIAENLFITERTVESHRKNMVEKANVRNTVELIAYAATLGLVKK